jgi:hypothetical protein
LDNQSRCCSVEIKPWKFTKKQLAINLYSKKGKRKDGGKMREKMGEKIREKTGKRRDKTGEKRREVLQVVVVEVKVRE